MGRSASRKDKSLSCRGKQIDRARSKLHIEGKVEGELRQQQLSRSSRGGKTIHATPATVLPADRVPPTAPLVDSHLFSRPWGLAVLAESFLGIRRFEQFQRRLGISRKTLSQRLSSLVDDGLLTREKYQSRPERFEYLLTAKGHDLFPIVLAIRNWGERWDGAADDNRWHAEHIPCQQPCSTSVICTHCAERIHHRDVRMGVSREGLAGSPASTY